jgi:hypothetical protein
MSYFLREQLLPVDTRVTRGPFYKQPLSILNFEPTGYFTPYGNNFLPLILGLPIVFPAGYLTPSREQLTPVGYNYVSAVISCFKELIVDQVVIFVV